MSISDTKKAQQYASIAETAAAQAKLSAEQLANAPDYAQQAAASAASASASAQTATAAESTVQALSNAASQSASDAAVSASEAASAADSAIGRTVRAPSGESLSALPVAADRASSVPVFGGDGSLVTKAIAEFAILDSSGKIPVSVIPAIALTEPFVASSQAAMLALDAQVGDICKRTDLGYSFCLASAPPSTLANWIQLTDDVLAQLGQKTGATQVGAADDSNNPTTVQAALNSKVSASTLSQTTGATLVGYTTGTVATQLDSLNTFKNNVTGSSGVTYVGGAAAQTSVDTLNNQNASFAYISDYASLVTSGDWTAAINAALATGKPVVGNGTYNVSGIINSKGQRIVGEFTINTSRYSLGSIKARTVDPDSASIRMLYVESAYDLAELLYIKSLGFNMINHYCTFANNGTIDAAGTAEQMLDNAYTAGLQVNLGIDNPRANANLTEFVTATTVKAATFGYSVYDEPATKGVTVAQQDAKITTLRGLTTKSLNFVDLIASGQPFNQLFSKNYDIAFVDSYSRYYSTGSYADWLKQDLAKMRLDFGTIKAMTGISIVIPVVSAYVDSTSQSYYSRDVDQVVAASSVFGKVCEGNFGAFVWDGVSGGFQGTVRNNVKCRNLVIGLASQKVRPKIKFEAYLFGGTPSSTIWPITSLFSKACILDTSTGNANVQGGSYPIRLLTNTSVAESDRTSTTTGYDYSGIAFKGTFASYNSGIMVGSHIRTVMEYFNLSGTTSGTFSLLSTNDNGYTISSPLYAAGLSSNNQVIDADVTPGDISVPPDNVLIFRVENSGANTSLKRMFLRGIVIVSNW